jgi:hypothetical protein
MADSDNLNKASYACVDDIKLEIENIKDPKNINKIK